MSISNRVESILWAIGLASLACLLFISLQAQHYRAHAASLSSGTPLSKPDAQDKVVGQLEIPALQLSVAVLANYDPDSLLKGVGHIQGTAQPGGLGTVGLAGHRDTFFRPLQRISPKMDIRLTDRTGTYHYSVDSTEIVTPDRIEVLAITMRPELTLITCFPFNYVGAAPKRFIVHAHLLSASPDIKLSQP